MTSGPRSVSPLRSVSFKAMFRATVITTLEISVCCFLQPLNLHELITQIDPFFFFFRWEMLLLPPVKHAARHIWCIRANTCFAPVPAAEVCDETAQLTRLGPVQERLT